MFDPNSFVAIVCLLIICVCLKFLAKSLVRPAEYLEDQADGVSQLPIESISKEPGALPSYPVPMSQSFSRLKNRESIQEKLWDAGARDSVKSPYAVGDFEYKLQADEKMIQERAALAEVNQADEVRRIDEVAVLVDQNPGLSTVPDVAMPADQNPGLSIVPDVAMPADQNPALSIVPDVAMPADQNPALSIVPDVAMPADQNPGLSIVPDVALPADQNPALSIVPDVAMPADQNPGLSIVPDVAMPADQNPALSIVPDVAMPADQNSGLSIVPDVAMPADQNPGLSIVPDVVVPADQNPALSIVPDVALPADQTATGAMEYTSSSFAPANFDLPTFNFSFDNSFGTSDSAQAALGTAAGAELKCPKCGSNRDRNFSFCISCGHSYDSPSA